MTLILMVDVLHPIGPSVRAGAAAGNGKIGLTACHIASTIGVSILSWYFSSMTVDVTDDELGWRFAGGQGYTIARAGIDRVRTVPHRLWAGYGIKYFGPKRWTYVIEGTRREDRPGHPTGDAQTIFGRGENKDQFFLCWRGR